MNAITPEKLTVDEEKKETVIINEQEYELVFSTYAVKILAKKYGGLEKLGETLINKQDKAFENLSFMAVTLINAGIALHNYNNPEDKKEPMTEEVFDILTTLNDQEEIVKKVYSAITKGFTTDVQITEAPKNTTAE